MGYFKLFCWPNHADRDQLATEHYQKAKAGVDLLDLNTEVAFCVARNEPGVTYTGLYVIYLVGQFYGNDTPGIHNQLEEFFKKCGCPEYQDFESPYVGNNSLTVDNLVATLKRFRIDVVKGPVTIRPYTLVHYEGRTVQEAQANQAAAGLPADQVISSALTQEPKQHKVNGQGKTPDEALASAKLQIPANALDISEPVILNQAQSGSFEIKAGSEIDANAYWHQKYKGKKTPDSAKRIKLECIQPPSKSFLSQKPGVWRVDWSAPCVTEISFKTPAVVTVKLPGRSVTVLNDLP